MRTIVRVENWHPFRVEIYEDDERIRFQSFHRMPKVNRADEPAAGSRGEG